MLRQCDLFDRIIIFRGRLLGNSITLLVSGLLFQIDKALLLLAAKLVVILLCIVIIIVLLAVIITALLGANLIGNSLGGVLIKFV